MPTRTREERYDAAARVYAETGQGIGIRDISMNRWAEIIVGIARFDDVFEAEPDFYGNSAAVLDHLNLDHENPDLIRGAKLLVDSGRQAEQAHDLQTHFHFRALEGIACTDLLRFSDGRNSQSQPNLWTQMEHATVAGTFLDSLLDAQEDVLRLPQFTARELAYASLHKFRSESRMMSRKTWYELIKASWRWNPSRQFSKPFLAAGVLAKVSMPAMITPPPEYQT